MEREQELLFGTQASASDIEEIKGEFHPSNTVNVEFALPVGAIITMSGNLAPTGYLPCDGTVYNIADYPNLANYYENAQGSKNFYGGDGTTTFAVPDYRGEFLRGTGTNSHTNQGNGANVGVHQDGTEFAKYCMGGTADNVFVCYVDANNQGNAWINSAEKIDKAFTTSTKSKLIVTAGYTENTSNNARYNARPTNTSVLYCVKY